MTEPSPRSIHGRIAGFACKGASRIAAWATAVGAALVCGAFAASVFLPAGAAGVSRRLPGTLPWLSLAGLAAVVAVAFVIGLGHRAGRRLTESVLGFAGIAAFAVLFVVSAAMSGCDGTRPVLARGPALVPVRAMFVALSVVAAATFSFGRVHPRHSDFIVDFLCLCGALEAFLVLLEFLLWTIGLREAVAALPWKIAMFRMHDGLRFIPGSLRPTGTFGNPNITAVLVAAAFPIALDHALRRPCGSAGRWPWFALAAMTVLAVSVTQSRAAYLGCAAAASALLAARRRTGRRVAIVLPLALLAVLALASHRRIASIRIVQQPAVQARIGVWRAAGSIWMTRPITGIGPGRFPEAYADLPGVDDRIDHIFPDAHSVWWTILAEQGVSGIAPIAVVLLAAAFGAVRATGRQRESSGHGDATHGGLAGAASALAAVCICFAFDNLVVSAAAAMLFWILTGAVLSAADAGSAHGSWAAADRF